MKTRSSRRPLAAVALATAVVLASGALARAEAATARAERHGRQQAAHGTPTNTRSAVQQWVSRLLAAVGLPPAGPVQSGTVSTPPRTIQDDNGAGIDPNG